MAGWQEELADLLRELGVTQEEPKTHLRPAGKLIRRDTRHRSCSHEEAADAVIFEHISSSDVDDDTVPYSRDIEAMRREVDSIVNQVIQLMQRGELDASLKEDVMVVLRALRRRATVTRQAAEGDEAYLESVAAMLHFCRLVLRLSETAIEDEL
ncbi:MAG TPA: hypothetical protein VFA41_11895 [Ktedonobacteraceae bacterium]|jgi:Mg2+ and Co2+ transporter CorA|nr:hypothetical protein [Ktedonobacteraceae bacterium]